MRKLTALILALMVLAASAAALADTEITVSGEGHILVSADTAVVNIGVNIRDRNALKAQQRANEVIAAVRKTLTENGIAAEDINTGYVELFTIYDYDYSSGSDAVSMYTANSMLAIQLKDMTQVGKVIDLAFGAGANSLNGVSFSASDTDAARKEALKAAEQAIARAEKEAGEMETELADPEIWKDPDKAAETTRRYNALKDEIERLYEQYDALENGL